MKKKGYVYPVVLLTMALAVSGCGSSSTQQGAASSTSSANASASTSAQEEATDGASTSAQEEDTDDGITSAQGEDANDGSTSAASSEEADGADDSAATGEGTEEYPISDDSVDMNGYLVRIDTEGMGQVARAEVGRTFAFDDDYPAQSTVDHLADGTKLLIGAKAYEDWEFVKWTLNGEEYSREEQFEFTVTEDASFVAFFSFKDADDPEDFGDAEGTEDFEDSGDSKDSKGSEDSEDSGDSEVTEDAEDSDGSLGADAEDSGVAGTSGAAEKAGTSALPAYVYQGDPQIAAVCEYLTHTIASGYLEAEVSIPYMEIVDTDDSNPDDTLVWGDFLVMNYDLAGDILETKSGGNHPGLMHLQKQKDGSYVVTEFEAVADGSDFVPSAKKIFGDKYDDFSKVQSDNEALEKVRKEYIREYVKSNGLPITAYQDYGWDPVALD